MSGARLARVAFIGLSAAALPLLGVLPGASAVDAHVTSAKAASVHADKRVLHYDASQAASWQANIDAAVKIWNESVNVFDLQPADGSGAVDFTFAAGDGWPETQPTGIGTGSITLGQQAVDQGYDKTRITAHEMGHVFGLPDDYSGPCSEIMSGHGPGTSCTNPRPDAKEIAQVEANFNGGGGLRAKRLPTVILDIPTAVAPRQLATR